MLCEIGVRSDVFGFFNEDPFPNTRKSRMNTTTKIVDDLFRCSPGVVAIYMCVYVCIKLLRMYLCYISHLLQVLWVIVVWHQRRKYYLSSKWIGFLNIAVVCVMINTNKRRDILKITIIYRLSFTNKDYKLIRTDVINWSAWCNFVYLISIDSDGEKSYSFKLTNILIHY